MWIFAGFCPKSVGINCTPLCGDSFSCFLVILQTNKCRCYKNKKLTFCHLYEVFAAADDDDDDDATMAVSH